MIGVNPLNGTNYLDTVSRFHRTNSRKISKALLGKGTQMPSPSQTPFCPARRCKNRTELGKNS